MKTHRSGPQRYISSKTQFLGCCITQTALISALQRHSPLQLACCNSSAAVEVIHSHALSSIGGVGPARRSRDGFFLLFSLSCIAENGFSGTHSGGEVERSWRLILGQTR